MDLRYESCKFLNILMGNVNVYFEPSVSKLLVYIYGLIVIHTEFWNLVQNIDSFLSQSENIII